MQLAAAICFFRTEARTSLGSTAITVDSSGAKASELRYKPYGEVRYSGLPNGTGTDYRFTGQRQLAGLGLYQMGARWVDPSLGRWLSADTLVPEPTNPQSVNRYSFVLGNPLIYRDPSGHWPEWFDRATGAFAQYVDDVTLGLFSALAGDLHEIENVPYQEGRALGRAVSTVQGTYEVAHGAAAVIAGFAAGPPTAAAGAACTAGTAGACALPTGIALTAEGATVIGGAVEAAHGGLMLAKIGNDPLDHVSKGNLKSPETRLLKKQGVDPHQVKRSELGKEANIKHWDIVQDTESGLYYLQHKFDKSIPLLEIGDLDDLIYLSEP